MILRRKIGSLLLMTVLVFPLLHGRARAHRFNVALVVPLSNAASAQGRQIREGFMLATKERDSHPDQESDGHLGGLDVYVTVIDEQGDFATEIARIVAQGAVDIVVAFGSDTTLALIGKLLDGKKAVLLQLGQSPFARPAQPGVAAFIFAYEREYGGRPSSHAAQGYNAARRIDVAVRTQGGADDPAALRRDFRKTARDFTW
jgi:outer membrane PBP1 activator LpoA protein